jgi:hypothetical protein
MECVPLRPSEKRALDTTENVLAALGNVSERDAAIDRLIAAIVRERVQLLAAVGRRAMPARLRGMSYPDDALARR